MLDTDPVWGLAPTDTARGLYTNVTTMLQRVREDVHPPLYFALLDVWVMAVGESVMALRYFSVLAAMLGLAATYALGVRLFDRNVALLAVIILMTLSFYVYFARELRMYSLVVALAALSTLVYLRWLATPTRLNTLFYTLTLAALLYTHYTTATLFVVHLGYLFLILLGEARFAPTKNTNSVNRIHLTRWILPFVLGLLLFTPWVPTLISQIQDNPNGPLAFPVPTNVETMLELVRIVAGGAGVVYGAVIIAYLFAIRVEHARPLRDREHKIKARTMPTNTPSLSTGRGTGGGVLLLLWLLLPPVLLWLINATLINIYQVRYVIFILPAWALLMGYVIIRVGQIRYFRALHAAPLLIALLVVIAMLQLTNYTAIWGTKPRWQDATQQMVNTRQPFEPAITNIAENSVLGYYDRQIGVRQGISLDLSWRNHSISDVAGYVDAMNNTPVLWLVAPTNVASTGYTAHMLNSANYQPTYRDQVLNVIYYRFERESTQPPLQFDFNDLLRYEGALNQQYTAAPGKAFCPDNVILRSLQPIDGAYSAGLHLTFAHERPMAQWDGGIGQHDSDETITINECLTIPPDAAPGNYDLRLLVYNWQRVKNLSVLETSAAPAMLWGEALFIAEVIVE